MKISNQLIDEVIINVAGEDVIPLVKVLKNKKNVSEFKLSEKIGLEINTTRNMLYRLYHSNLVSFVRRKDKKKGWYIYYWTFNMKRIRNLVLEIKRKKIESLKEKLDNEKSHQFFICPNMCMRMEFDNATEFDFKCAECGELMNIQDNTTTIENIEKEIKKLEKEIK